MDKFLEQYIETALWSSVDESGNPLDDNYGPEDLTTEAIASMKADCDDFRNTQAALLEGIDDEQAAHDFWLTRNRHGAGFWDRGLGEIGQRLTDAASVYGSSDIYIGDDGKLYVS